MRKITFALLVGLMCAWPTLAGGQTAGGEAQKLPVVMVTDVAGLGGQLRMFIMRAPSANSTISGSLVWSSGTLPPSTQVLPWSSLKKTCDQHCRLPALVWLHGTIKRPLYGVRVN